MQIETVQVGKVLTRSGGYLQPVCSHSLQPYVGCPLGSSLCGVGCYVRHNPWLLRGRPWGSFLQVRENADRSYLQHVERERVWARQQRGEFAIFMSSSTEPFPPQERRYRATQRILQAMLQQPPDQLIVQTHSHRVSQYKDLLVELSLCCRLRLHLSIESDRERLPGLPPPGSTIVQRMEAAAELKSLGLEVVITVAPLLPIASPDRFFARLAEVANAVVIDHFRGGDGSRTLRTALPAAMAAVEPRSLELSYRDEMVQVARQHFPGRVGVGAEGFAGRYLR